MFNFLERSNMFFLRFYARIPIVGWPIKRWMLPAYERNFWRSMWVSMYISWVCGVFIRAFTRIANAEKNKQALNDAYCSGYSDGFQVAEAGHLV